MIEDKRADRQRDTAEIFTPVKVVQDMLFTLPQETWEPDKTFLDPACGNGNILVAVLRRKLGTGHKPLMALRSVYGADIMRDNVRECRLRLLKVVSGHARKITKAMIAAVFANIVWVPRKRFPNGSLDYDFDFPPTQSKATVKEWAKTIGEKLATVGEEGLLADLKDSETEEFEAKQEENAIRWE